LSGGETEGQELKELQPQGMSIQAISELTGWARKTIRKYMKAAGVVPEFGPRAAQPNKLDAFKPYLEERLPDSDGLVATTTQRRTPCGRASLRDSSVPKCPQCTCACLATQSRRAYFFSHISPNSVIVPAVSGVDCRRKRRP
jgi:hypothetical protein